MPTLERDGLTGLRTGPDPSRRSGAPLVVAGVVTVGLVASVLAARYTGAADPLPGGLTDAGPVVRWSLPLVRVVHDVAASLTIGSLLLAATMIPGRSRAESAALDEPRRAAAFVSPRRRRSSGRSRAPWGSSSPSPTPPDCRSPI